MKVFNLFLIINFFVDEKDEALKLDDPLATPAQKIAAAEAALVKQKAKEEELLETRSKQIKALYQNIDGLHVQDNI